jgi:hypothetical protein
MKNIYGVENFYAADILYTGVLSNREHPMQKTLGQSNILPVLWIIRMIDCIVYLVESQRVPAVRQGIRISLVTYVMCLWHKTRDDKSRGHSQNWNWSKQVAGKEILSSRQVSWLHGA